MNPLHPLNLHTAGVSNGARCHRHLERGCMPLWETDRNRSHDALSREISLLIADGIVTRRRASGCGWARRRRHYKTHCP